MDWAAQRSSQLIYLHKAVISQSRLRFFHRILGVSSVHLRQLNAVLSTKDCLSWCCLVLSRLIPLSPIVSALLVEK